MEDLPFSLISGIGMYVGRGREYNLSNIEKEL